MTVRMKGKKQGTGQKVEDILRGNNDLRIVVVGTTCTGKSTMVTRLKKDGLAVQDMDELIFPKLTKEETERICQTPWTKDIGNLMDKLARKYVQVKPGEPIFGTVVFDCDLIVYLKISDSLLKERIIERKVDFDDAKGMQHQIEKGIRKSGIRCIELEV